MAKGRITEINFKEQTITFVYNYKWYDKKPNVKNIVNYILSNAAGVENVDTFTSMNCIKDWHSGELKLVIKFSEEKLNEFYEKNKDHLSKKPSQTFDIISQEQALTNVCKNS